MKKKNNQLIYIIGINCEVGKILNKKFREAGYRVDGCSSKINGAYDYHNNFINIDKKILEKIRLAKIVIILSWVRCFNAMNDRKKNTDLAFKIANILNKYTDARKFFNSTAIAKNNPVSFYGKSKKYVAEFYKKKGIIPIYMGTLLDNGKTKQEKFWRRISNYKIKIQFPVHEEIFLTSANKLIQYIINKNNLNISEKKKLNHYIKSVSSNNHILKFNFPFLLFKYIYNFFWIVRFVPRHIDAFATVLNKTFKNK
jgi:hypothetical protein